jgi:transposase
MSLQPTDAKVIPEDTARVARAAFPHGTLAMSLRDTLGNIFADPMFVTLFAHRGQPAASPWRLALVTVLQFAENLSDRQAAEAVRGRIDWKYALGLALTDSGFDFSVLSKFRTRLLAGNMEHLLLEALLEACKAHGLLRPRGRARTDSTHVVAAVRALNRLESVTETLRAALNAVAVAAPEWLQGWVPGVWFERYATRAEESRLPKGLEARQTYAEMVGQDGLQLLEAVYGPTAPAGLAMLPTLETLRQTWVYQYWKDKGKVRFREAQDLPPAGMRMDSPYDPEAHFGNKRSLTWTGYKAHLTESCDEQCPHLITHVTTTSAGVTDITQTAGIHHALGQKQLLPQEHFADAGYVDAELIVRSATHYGIELIGPVRPDVSWQAHTPEAFDIAQFTVDWEKKAVTCPQGKVSSSWTPYQDPWGNHLIRVKFAYRDCIRCTHRVLCTKAKTTPRCLSLRQQQEHQVLTQVRQDQGSPVWRQRYRKRAGVEGTISQGVRVTGLRRTRYRGLAKTHLQHLASAAALNVQRIAAWVAGNPRSKTRVSRFAALATKVAL